MANVFFFEWLCLLIYTSVRWETFPVSSTLLPWEKKTKTRSSTSCLAGLCWNDNTALERSCSGHGIIPGECEPSLSTESCFTWPSTQPALLMVLTAPSTASPELVLHALHISTHTGAKEWIMSSYETCTSKKDCGQGRIWYTASIKLGA